MIKRKKDYAFTMVPVSFIYLMDCDCYKLMSLLMQEESYWKSKDKLFQGWFYKSLDEIKEVLSLKNSKDVRLTIEALYRKGLIEVRAEDGKRKTLRFRLRWGFIEDLAQMSITDIVKFEEKITRLGRNEEITYCERFSDDDLDTYSEQDVYEMDTENEQEMYEIGTGCTPTIYNIEKNKKKIKKKEVYSYGSSSWDDVYANNEEPF